MMAQKRSSLVFHQQCSATYLIEQYGLHTMSDSRNRYLLKCICRHQILVYKFLQLFVRRFYLISSLRHYGLFVRECLYRTVQRRIIIGLFLTRYRQCTNGKGFFLSTKDFCHQWFGMIQHHSYQVGIVHPVIQFPLYEHLKVLFNGTPLIY
jgi:hypothetical protein